jgi:hypothetical protein
MAVGMAGAIRAEKPADGTHTGVVIGAAMATAVSRRWRSAAVVVAVMAERT